MNFTVPNNKLNKQECPLAVIRCVDWRFRESDQEFITKGLGFEDFDLYSWPGAAQEVLKDNGFKRSFVERVVSVSKNLHSIKKLLLLWNLESEEIAKKELQTVKDMLTPELPEDLEIIMAYSKATPQGLEYKTIE